MSGGSGSSNPLISPSRTPLTVVNGPNIYSSHRGLAATASSSPATPSAAITAQMASGSPSPLSAPGTASSSPRTTTEDRLRKKLLRKNDKGETHLHRAAIKGNKKVAEKLLRIGIDPNGVDHAGGYSNGYFLPATVGHYSFAVPPFAGYTPLHEACNRGHLSVARLLVKHGANVNLYGGTDDQKETALHDAARNGHSKVSDWITSILERQNRSSEHVR